MNTRELDGYILLLQGLIIVIKKLADIKELK